MDKTKLKFILNPLEKLEKLLEDQQIDTRLGEVKYKIRLMLDQDLVPNADISVLKAMLRSLIDGRGSYADFTFAHVDTETRRIVVDGNKTRELNKIISEIRSLVTLL